MATICSLFLAGCSRQPADTPLVDVVVRIYVDRDASGTWNDGDIPLPNISVSLDGESTATSDQEGLTVFEDISQSRHTIALNEEDFAELESYSLICDSRSQTVEVAGNTEISFCFSAKGFLEVEVEEEQQGK